ncbi:MAG: phosphonate ABC transporter, permease protein PhnE [Halanaerobium sp.]
MDNLEEIFNDKQKFRKHISRRSDLIKAGMVFAFVLILYIISLMRLNINLARIQSGIGNLQEFWVGMFPPDFSILGRVIPLAIESMQIAIMGTVLGLILSAVLGMLAAKNLSPIPGLSTFLKGLFALTRAIPALIWALLFIVAVGLGSLPGILALGVNSIGMLGKVFSETFENVDKGILEGLRSTGASDLQVFCQGVIPETIPILVSWSVFRLDINIRYSSILGVVGAGGIGWELVRASRMLDYQAVLTVTMIIFVMIYSFEQLTSTIRKMVN